jgi:hypothetical protein
MNGQIVTQVLEKVGEIHFPGANKFVAREHFTEPKFWLSDSFKVWMLPKVEKGVKPSTLTYGKLMKSAKDAVIILALGGEEKAESSLVKIFHLTSLQPNGEEGTLLTNGWVNIFFVKDAKGILRTVRAYWSDGEWRLGAGPTPDKWRAGYRVFSRNLAF